MLETVIIKKSGFYVQNERVDDLSLVLGHDIEIEKDVCLEDIFDTLSTMDELDYLFKPYTRGFEFKPFYDELKSEPKKISEIISLVFQWSAEISEWENDDCEVESEFDEYIHVSGISSDIKSWGIDLIPLNQIKDCSLTLDDMWILRKNHTEEIVTTRKAFSFGEIIGSLLYEITFHGYPESKAEAYSELIEVSDRIENEEEEMIPYEEIKLEFLEKELKRLVEDEKFEKANKVKKEIELIKIEIKKQDN